MDVKDVANFIERHREEAENSLKGAMPVRQKYLAAYIDALETIANFIKDND